MTDWSQAERQRVRRVCLADVEPETVTYLWGRYIPQGKLTIIEGDPGQGKSWLTLAIAACVSTGGELPGSWPVEAGPVLLLCGEDGPADTIRPRLDRLSADVEQIHVISAPLTLDADGTLDLIQHVEEVEPKLVVLDPLQLYMAGVDLHRANETRPLMAALAGIAEAYNCAVVAVRHLSKQEGGKAAYRGLGSIDIVAAARSVLLVGTAQDGRRGLVHIKHNLSLPGDPREFEIGGALGFSWLPNESELTAADLLHSGEAKPREVAADFLLAFLADGPKPANVVKAAAAERQISTGTLKRAKRDLGIDARKDGLDGGWLWALGGDFSEGDQVSLESKVIPFEGDQKSKSEPLRRGSDSPLGKSAPLRSHPPDDMTKGE